MNSGHIGVLWLRSVSTRHFVLETLRQLTRLHFRRQSGSDVASVGPDFIPVVQRRHPMRISIIAA